jgi:lipopolysaccharide/colanic/teichoic acid biosynthesis glycosyltransferase
MSLRRSFDVAVAVLVLTVFALPFLLAALAIKLSSRGPIFFVQQRVGKGGTPFSLYKFRTMAVAKRGPRLTMQNDTRVTTVGRILRRWKIDEIPQLWNILRGDMTIIGPRPEVPDFVARFGEAERRLLDYVPGLAGMAVLVYPNEAELLRGDSDPERAYAEQLVPKKAAVDLAYEAERTFASDLRLMVEITLAIFGWNRHADRTFRVGKIPTSAISR